MSLGNVSHASRLTILLLLFLAGCEAKVDDQRSAAEAPSVSEAPTTTETQRATEAALAASVADELNKKIKEGLDKRTPDEAMMLLNCEYLKKSGAQQCDMQQVEAEMKANHERRAASTPLVDDVHLARLTSNTYLGLTHKTDGSERKISVTVFDDGKLYVEELP